MKKYYSIGISYLLLGSIIAIFFSCQNDPVEDKSAENFKVETEIDSPTKFDHLYFVGSYGGQSSIYKFDFNNLSHKIFWYSPKETVIKYLYSKNFGYSFFLTARRIGTNRGLSFIRGIKLYRLDPESSLVEQVSTIGDAIQIFVQWVDLNFNIQFTRFDLKVASHVNKINQIYSPYGKKLNEEIQVFDFISDRYPQFDVGRISLSSPSGNLSVIQTGDSIFIEIANDEQKIFIDSAGESINKIKWSKSEDHVIFTVFKMRDDKGRNGSSKIFIYNLREQILEAVEESTKKMDFIIVNDLVIFENGSDSNSFLTIYNFEKGGEMHRIKIQDGCGLSAISGV
jgi:hypothetical protein